MGPLSPSLAKCSRLDLLRSIPTLTSGTRIPIAVYQRKPSTRVYTEIELSIQHPSILQLKEGWRIPTPVRLPKDKCDYRQGC
jgi:hypothetical protein